MSDLVIFHYRQFPACRLLPGGYFWLPSCMSVPDHPNATSDTIPTPPPPRVILLMGVCGCGKSRIGELLASGLKGRFIDADDLHPPANKAKMSAKIPLTDDDRWPWLDIVRRDAIDTTPPGGTTVLACSALKKSYRTHLMAGAPGVRLLYLKGAFDLIAERLAARRGHFMPPDLLRSQFATLEEPSPDEGCTVSIAGPVDEVVSRCMACLTESRPSERDPELQR